MFTFRVTTKRHSTNLTNGTLFSKLYVYSTFSQTQVIDTSHWKGDSYSIVTGNISSNFFSSCR